MKDAPFTVTGITTKKGHGVGPRLFDLTSLQVECNKKFAYSADDTLKLIQSLYEKKDNHLSACRHYLPER